MVFIFSLCALVFLSFFYLTQASKKMFQEKKPVTKEKRRKPALLKVSAVFFFVSLLCVPLLWGFLWLKKRGWCSPSVPGISEMDWCYSLGGFSDQMTEGDN